MMQKGFIALLSERASKNHDEKNFFFIFKVWVCGPVSFAYFDLLGQWNKFYNWNKFWICHDKLNLNIDLNSELKICTKKNDFTK